eukprot:1870069-Lingulodinium_polyedra.AAC.1
MFTRTAEGRETAVAHARVNINALHCIALHCEHSRANRRSTLAKNTIDIEHAVSTVPLPCLDLVQT